MKQGQFITFEGGDGAGKSTQAQLLRETLTTQGHDIILTREPGGCSGAEDIRNVLLKGHNWQPFAELCLLSAARQIHVNEVIRPALESGKTVICDRFIDSTIAYQCYAGGMDRALVEQLNQQATGGLVPDKTIYLDIDPHIGLNRVPTAADHFEQKALEFHEKLRAGFVKLAKEHPDRTLKIDAGCSEQVILEQVLFFLDQDYHRG